MKKKFYAVLLAGCLALTAAACGSTETETNTDTSATEEEQTEGKSAETGSSRLVSVENVDKYVTLGEYKGLTLDNTVNEVTENDITAQIDTEMQENAEVVSDGARDGDLVTINFVGTKDGVAFDGGTANNYDLTVGSAGMIDGFEDGLIGMKKGETKDLNLTFPENYQEESLAGQAVVFQVTMQNVRRKPDLTDEWVSENTDYANVNEYREAVRQQLEEKAEASAQEVLKSTAWSTVLENSEVKEYPQEDIDRAKEEFRSYIELYAQQSDMELEEFIESQGVSQEDFDQQSQQYAESKVKQNLIVQGIMDAEGLTLDDKESLEIQNALVEQYGYSNIAQLVEAYGEDYVNESVGLLRVEDFLVQNAQVTEMIANGETTGVNADAAAQDTQEEMQSQEENTQETQSQEDTDQESGSVDEELEAELGTEEDTGTVDTADAAQ